MKEERMCRDEGMIGVRIFCTVLVLVVLLPVWSAGSTMAQVATAGTMQSPDKPDINVNVSNFKELVRGNTTDGVWSVSWSPDETKIVSGQRDNLTVIRDASNLSIKKVLSAHIDQVFSVAWSPAGDKILAGSWDGYMSIWDATTGALLYRLEGDQSGIAKEVRTVCWSPDGTKAVSGGDYDQKVRIWDANTGTLLNTLVGHTGSIESLAWSPDGNLLASGSDTMDPTIRIWNPITGMLMRALTGHSGIVSTLDWSRDSKFLLSTEGFDGTPDDKIIRLWNVSTGRIIQNFMSPLLIHDISSAVFSPDDSMIAAGTWNIDLPQNNVIHIWNTTTGILLKTLIGHSYGVRGVRWSPTGTKIASGSLDDTMRIWGESPVQDTIKPMITITFPTNGDILPAKEVTVTGMAWDDVAVRKVEVSTDASNWTFCLGKTAWQGDLTLKDGPNTIYAKATDTSDNWAMASVNVTVNASDKTKPTVTITYPKNGDTLMSKNVTVTGTASDDVAVKRVEVMKDGLNWIPCTGTTSWSVDLVLKEGSNTIAARAYDTAGNSATTDVTVIVSLHDLTKPTIAITWPKDGALMTTEHVTVRGIASDNVKVKEVHISGDGTNWMLCAGTASWSSDFTLTAGKNNIRAMATDTSGNWNITSIEVVADLPDTAKPNITIESPKDGDLFTSLSITVNGTAHDNNGVQRVEISTDLAKWTLCSGTTSWKGDLTLNEGSNTIYARATDIAGNVEIASVTVTVETPGYIVSKYISWIAFLIIVIIVFFIMIVILLRRRRRMGMPPILSFSKTKRS